MSCSCGVEPSARDFGVEVQGVYDGIGLWQCYSCGKYRPRFDPPGRLHNVFKEIAERWNNDAAK